MQCLLPNLKLMKKNLLILAAAIFATSLHAADFPEGSPKFATNAEVAMKAAQTNGKPIILVFSAAWCGPCQTMKKEVYPNAEVKPFHDKFNWAYLDIDVEANSKLSNTYHVEVIPNIVFLNAAGQKIDQQEGGGAPDVFAQTLAKVLKKSGAPKAVGVN